MNLSNYSTLIAKFGACFVSTSTCYADSFVLSALECGVGGCLATACNHGNNDATQLAWKFLFNTLTEDQYNKVVAEIIRTLDSRGRMFEKTDFTDTFHLPKYQEEYHCSCCIRVADFLCALGKVLNPKPD